MYRNQLLHTWTICGVCNHYHQQWSQRTTCANIGKMPRNQTLHAENSTIAIKLKALLYASRIWEKNTKPKHHLARRVTVPVTALDQMILLNVLQLWRPLLFLWLIAMYQTVKRNHLSWTVAIDAHAKSEELEVIAHPARLNTCYTNDSNDRAFCHWSNWALSYPFQQWQTAIISVSATLSTLRTFLKMSVLLHKSTKS